MAMVRTRRLATHKVAVAATLELVYTVPPASRAIIRDVRLGNPSAAAPWSWQLIADSVIGSALAYIHLQTVQVSAPGFFVGDVVLEAGDHLYSVVTVAGGWIWVSGALLDVPPSASTKPSQPDRVVPTPLPV